MSTVTLIQLGSKGAEVTQIQQCLRKLGYDLGTDGDFGPETDAIVRQFQAEHGLDADGKVGTETRKKLFGDAAHKTTQSSASVSRDLIEAVARWEGGQGPDGKFHPYWDNSGKVWTIGYGHTGSDVSERTAPWSADKAKSELQRQLNAEFLPAVLSFDLPLNQKQIDALASFVYNAGVYTLNKGRSLGDALRGKNWQTAAPDAMLLYDHAGGQKLAGLTKRRQWEASLFKGGSYAH
jgi:GH24 family phage-related lysozyme (muramidase)